MPKRIASLLGAILILLAACSGATATDEALPTLAHLPTTAPSETVVPASPSPVFTDSPTATPIATAVETKTSADATADADAPAEPTATLLPESSQASIFPTLVADEDTTLQGQMTIIDDSHATLTDSEGHTATILIDPFAAQIGANQLVQIRGMAELEGDQMVLRMTEITLLNEAMAEPEATDVVVPSPTAG